MPPEVAERVGLTYPSQLFRYRSLENSYSWEELERAVRHRQLFLSSSASVNDPFEFSPNLVKSPLKELNKDIRATERGRGPLKRSRMQELAARPVSRSEYREYKSKVRNPVVRAQLEHKATLQSLQRSKEKSRLACFCESPEVIPMWAHYANHTGVCLVFSVDAGDEDILHEHFPLKVKYFDTRPEISTMDVRVFTERSRLEHRVDSIRDKVFDALFFAKAKDWSYEREWRIVDTKSARAGYEIVTSMKVDAIILGIRAKKSDIVDCLHRFGTDVEILKAEPAQDRFGLHFFPVRLR